jgi:hypothetical protein
MLEFYSASSTAVNSKRAMSECLEIALENEDNLDCDLIILYTTIGHNFKDLLSEAHRISPSAQIVGSTCAGIIGKETVSEAMRALAIMAVKGDRNEFAIAYDSGEIHQSPYQHGAKMANDLMRQNPAINMIHYILGLPTVEEMLSLTRTFAETVIEGFESVFGPKIPIFGGLGIDNMKLVNNYQFVMDEILERGAVAIGFADPSLELVCQANHGFDIVGPSVEVTRSENGRIMELDNKPAWLVVQEMLGVHDALEIGIITAFVGDLNSQDHDEYGNSYIVHGSPMPFPDNSVFVLRNTPKGTKLWLAKHDESKIFDGLDRMMEKIIGRCEGRKPIAVFHADCVFRGKISFDKILKEELVGHMQYPLFTEEGTPWLGMYAAGEYARLGGRNFFHNFTTSLNVILRRDS